jgi:hypothetical protein
MLLLLRPDNGWSAISPENRDPLFRIALKTLKFEGAQAPKKEARPKDRAHLTRCSAIYAEIVKKQWIVEWIRRPAKDYLSEIIAIKQSLPDIAGVGTNLDVVRV